MPKLLIVDDEEDVREFTANFFRRRKIEVATAASGEEALAQLQKNKTDLVLLDIKMPGIDGIETLKRLRDIDSTIKVIMVTGRKPEEEGSFDKCKTLGVVDYLHKPIELEDLEHLVLSQLTVKK